jgi:predicted Rossmann-fold nucleotide-binding protein
MRMGGYHIGFAGTSHVREEDERYRAWRRIAECIGAEIMRRGHRLVTGGCSGGLSQYCVESARNWLRENERSAEQELRIISIVPEQMPATVSIGRVLMCKDWSRHQRRAYMASLEDALITVAGVHGTLYEGQCAFCLGTPVVPLYATGGATDELWQQIKTEFSGHPWYERLLGSPLWKEANDEYLRHPEKAAEVAVDFAVDLAELRLRRTPGIGPGVPTAFVIMPFGGFDDVYEKIRLAVGDAERRVGHIECHRADQQRTGTLDESIFRAIEEARLLIVDLTGNNGNVLLEYGYGLALNKKAILLNQRPGEALTDLKNRKQIPYERGAGGFRLLQADLADAIREFFEPRGANTPEHQSDRPESTPLCRVMEKERRFDCCFRREWARRMC